jgi:cell wall-associated NlpC family hydrolase
MLFPFANCNVSVASLKKEPTHQSEQVSELLFGERVEILKTNEQGWAYIIADWDGYEGWCRGSQLTTISKKEYLKERKWLTTKLFDKFVFEEQEMWLPYGAEIHKSKLIIDESIGKFKGKRTVINKQILDESSIIAAAKLFLQAPYLWGGRTLAGIDCSGLSQMAYKLCNKKISRDAAQQATEGEIVDFLQNARAGDLAFCDNAEGKIIHVGILIDAQNIIHATESSGRVVIDKIDGAGIISKSLRMRTHNLRMVRRYF